jgi:hypothetical protein
LILQGLAEILRRESGMTVKIDTTKNYYEVLGVSDKATSEDIKSAYRKLALKWHPDVCKEPFAHDRFVEISLAYQIIGNPEIRQRYDYLRKYAVASDSDYSNYQYYREQQETFYQDQQQARQRAHEYASKTLEEVLGFIFASAVDIVATSGVWEIPKKKIPFTSYISAGIKLFILYICVFIPFTRYLSVPGILIGLLIGFVMVLSLSRDAKRMGIINLIRAFLFVTVPLIVICFILIISIAY